MSTRENSIRPSSSCQQLHPTHLIYRITGAAAQARVVPLLQERAEVHWIAGRCQNACNQADPPVPLDFVWETNVARRDKPLHDCARVLNRLSNTVILENKAYFSHILALVSSQNQDIPVLETAVVRAMDAQAWLDARRRQLRTVQNANYTVFTDCTEDAEEWWILKAAGANGGGDVHVLPPACTHVPACIALRPLDSYVVQRYITRPLLLEKKYKFHYRVYALLRMTGVEETGRTSVDGEARRARFQPWIYQHGFILRASKRYHHATKCGSANEIDAAAHLTNLSLNKHCPGYPGQLPIDLARAPRTFGCMKAHWAAVVRAAAPFLRAQASSGHFELFGLDFLPVEAACAPEDMMRLDKFDSMYLMEINRLPGLQSSRQNSADEDELYDCMIRELLDLCVMPFLSGTGAKNDYESKQGGWSEVVIKDVDENMFVDLASPGDKEIHHNVLRWAMHMRACRNSVKTAICEK